MSARPSEAAPQAMPQQAAPRLQPLMLSPPGFIGPSARLRPRTA
jgi:hypothetical protein